MKSKYYGGTSNDDDDDDDDGDDGDDGDDDGDDYDADDDGDESSNNQNNNRYNGNDVLFPFRWLSMLSSHLSLGLPRGLFHFIFNFITTLSVDSSSLLMTRPNHRRLLLLIT